MNKDYILKRISPHVAAGKLIYNDFEKIFGFLSRNEQLAVINVIQDDLHIELVGCAEKSYVAEKIRLCVTAGKLTYDDFGKIFGTLPRDEQLDVINVIQDDLHIEVVDELDAAPEEELSAEVAQLIVKDPSEIKVPNKFLIRLIQDGDLQARQDLCIKNSGLVGKYAVRYHRQHQGKLELEDLMQEGYGGMLTAAEKFDLSKGAAFSTYAVYWICQAILRAIANTALTIRLPVHIVEKIFKASKIDRQLQLQNISVRRRIELIAEQMNLSAEKVRELFKLQKIYMNMPSLDTPVGEDSDTPLAEFIISDENPTDDAVSIVLLREQLENILGTLTKREQAVLALRYGLLDGQERTLEAVGKRFNVTRERIRQIEAKALRKLRHPARSNKLKDFY